MEWWEFLLAFFSALAALMVIGVPVAISFIVVNLVGVYFLWGSGGFNQIILSIDSSIASFMLVPIPMFILMGCMMFHTGIAERLINVLDQWLGFIAGRLAVLAVGAGTILAMLTGVAMGSVAMLGSTLTPEMERRGYSKTMSLGPILGSGALAILMPSSTLAIVLASVGGFSIAKVLVGVVIPGIMLATMYIAYIVIRATLQPHVAPAYEVPRVPLGRKLKDTALYLVPPVSIIVLVVGLIFGGIATPTEAASIGTFMTFVLAFLYGKLNWAVLKKGIGSATHISVMILLILTGSAGFGQLLSFSGATTAITGWATELPVHQYVLMAMMMITVMVIGIFLEQISIVLITVPIFMPVVHAMGWDPIWFAIIMMVNLELDTIMPPAGLSLFVMKGIAPKGTTMGDIYRAAMPFVLMNITLMILMIMFPQISLWLPSLMP
ncbi:TRAP transporter large permease subunit [Aminobacter sp. AP02]|uniref:TRAP transporter large permease n=1 Tax=Aminobacter sp. AP02 TaxID=2135737 RepID=UPI000D6C4935|nr:TRAP transporter large permease subunit [Aminobacter sp. AP02]PWK61260.1 tripartite ATP-independent transporter DctM subunit [Aminobacter sp. AP02]